MKKMKKKPGKIARFIGVYMSKLTWLALVGLCYYLYTVFQTFPMFPPEWTKYLLFAEIGTVVVTGLLVWIPGFNTGKILTMILNVLLCGCLAVSSWYLPTVRASIEKAFAEVPLEGEAEINFYVLKDEYKMPSVDQGTDGEENLDENEVAEDTVEKTYELKDYAQSLFIVQNSADLENQEYAMLVVQREMMTDKVRTVGTDTIFDAVDRLYDGTGEIMVMNVDYLPIIEDITGYEDFEERVEVVYTVYKKLTISTEAKNVKVTTEPFNILIAGNDDFGKVTTKGRTDVNMIASVNPITKQVAFVTVPRDAYVPNACLYNHDDKLTHAGISGIKCTVETIENYFGIDINYYVVINFSSLIKMVDALGGIDINNPYTFKSTRLKTWKGTFKKGNIHLNGKKALVYCRERHNLKNGDVDRAKHQTMVIRAMLDKITTPAVITKVDKLLESLSGTFKTNIKMDSIYALAQMQLDDMAVWNMVSYSMGGTPGMDYVASLGSKNKYSVMYLNDKQVKFVKKVMKAVKNGEILEQEKLPS